MPYVYIHNDEIVSQLVFWLVYYDNTSSDEKVEGILALGLALEAAVSASSYGIDSTPACLIENA